MNAARQDSNVDDEHDPEGATIAFELSQASALLDQSRKGLAQIEAALARIEAGTYGVCAVCGEEIAEGRLEARPWTPYCIRHSAGPSGPAGSARGRHDSAETWWDRIAAGFSQSPLPTSPAPNSPS